MSGRTALTETERRAMRIIRNNPHIEGGGRFFRAMWPEKRTSFYGAANFLLGRLYERGLVSRRHHGGMSSGDKGCNIYWLSEKGEIAISLEKSRP